MHTCLQAHTRHSVVITCGPLSYSRESKAPRFQPGQGTYLSVMGRGFSASGDERDIFTLHMAFELCQDLSPCQVPRGTLDRACFEAEGTVAWPPQEASPLPWCLRSLFLSAPCEVFLGPGMRRAAHSTLPAIFLSSLWLSSPRLLHTAFSMGPGSPEAGPLAGEWNESLWGSCR